MKYFGTRHQFATGGYSSFAEGQHEAHYEASFLRVFTRGPCSKHKFLARQFANEARDAHTKEGYPVPGSKGSLHIKTSSRHI